MIAPVFLYLLFGLIETGIVYFVQESLETLAEKVSRLIVIGTVATESDGEAALRQVVCRQLPGYMKCGQLRIDLSAVSSPGKVNVNTYPVKSSIGRYSPVVPGEVSVLRLYYDWPVRISPFSVVRGFQSKAGYTLIATRVAKIESGR